MKFIFTTTLLFFTAISLAMASIASLDCNDENSDDAIDRCKIMLSKYEGVEINMERPGSYAINDSRFNCTHVERILTEKGYHVHKCVTFPIVKSKQHPHFNQQK